MRRAGPPHAAALAAITTTPASAFGMPRHGRLTPGALANIALWSGDPLELSTRLEHLFVHGTEVSLLSRQSLLRDKYRKVPLPVRPL